jgi:hypothetical protein
MRATVGKNVDVTAVVAGNDYVACADPCLAKIVGLGYLALMQQIHPCRGKYLIHFAGEYAGIRVDTAMNTIILDEPIPCVSVH